MTLPANSPASPKLAQATALVREGRLGDAFAAFDQAVALDPASAPLRAAFGQELANVATRVSDPRVRDGVLRDAESVLLDAVGIDWDDPAARRSLQLLSSVLCVPVAPGTPETLRLLAEGDAHFGAGRRAEALRCYERVVAADPSHWTAVKYAGNCHYDAGDMATAERWFRRAAEMQPRDPQAQRFLCDALGAQGRHDAMWDAAYAAVAAHPRYWSAWFALDAMLRRAGRALRPCRLVPAAALTVGPDGKQTVSCDPRRTSDETAAWVVHAVHAAAQRAPNATAFQQERAAMGAMARHVRESQRASGQQPAYPLRMVEAADAAGELDALVFVLRYREAFREEFEAWKRAGVGAPPDTTHRVKMFLMRSQLRPL